MQSEEELIIIYSGYNRKTFVYKTGRSISVSESDLTDEDLRDWKKGIHLLNGIARRHED